MQLPILNFAPPVTPPDLVRHYHKLVHDFNAALAEPEPIDIGVAFCNPELPDVPEANTVFDAALPPGLTASEAIDAADAFFTERGTKPLRWVINPSAPVSQTAPLVTELNARGYLRQESPVLHQARRATIDLPALPGLMIIPARSAFGHAHELAVESTGDDANAAAAIVQHLDEPRFDALLALQDGKAMGRIGVLAVGDMGLIEQLYVSPAQRDTGLDSILLSRAIAFCARSGFKHVLTGDGGAHDALFRRNGFEQIGTFLQYVRRTGR